MSAITPLPTPPSTNDPANFATEADAFLGALPTFGDELNDYAEALNSFSTSATSVTSNTVGTGSKSFTVETAKSFLPGMSLTIARTAAPTNRMFAVVSTYNSGTGALVVTSQAFEGSGTFTDWTITLGFNGVVSANQLASTVFNDLTETTPALTDFLAGADTSASGGKIKILASALRDLFAPRGYIDGCIMSTAGSSATMTIAAGEAKDSSNAVLMQLAASISKTTSAWAVGSGNGGLDTGAIANNTWYHFYLIRRPDTGVVDVVFSTNASTPTLPANYTQYRRIGSGRTNGSAQWVTFLQIGDNFVWTTPDISASNVTVGAARTNVTTLTPLGIRTVGIYNVYLSNSTAVALRLYGINEDDAAVAADNMTLFNAANSTQNQTVKQIHTNTTSQVSWRASAAGTTGCYLQTLGYIDTRGKDA